MAKKIEMIGKKFDRLEVIEEAGRNHRMEVLWLCVCDCGNEVVINGVNLRSGNSKSCGCRRKEAASKSFTKHGRSSTRLYQIWNQVVQRCTNPKSEKYEYYGGRGIKLCDRWLDVDLFFVDMEEVYDKHVDIYGEKDTTIDRIDPNGDYEPNNCRWTTRSQQSRNTRVRPTSLTGVHGVYWNDLRNKWEASISVGKRKKYLGIFDDVEEAIAVRKQAEIELDYFSEERAETP